MTDETLKTRYADEKFVTFLKVGETLYCARDALSDLCKREMDEFQQEILKICNIDPSKEYKKHTCESKDIKKSRLKYTCLDGICNNMLREVEKAKVEVNGSKSGFWSNSDLKKWPTDSWEIAKVFMGQGQKPENKGPLETDSSGIFHLIRNCDRFQKYNISEKDMHELIDKRNAIAHAAVPWCSDVDLDGNIAFLIKFFETLSCEKDVKEKEKSDMEDAIRHLKDLTRADFKKYLCVKHKEEQICDNTLNELLHDISYQIDHLLQMFGQLPFQETMQENGKFKSKMVNFLKTMFDKVSSSRTKIHSQDYQYDIHMIYCAEHAHDAAKLQEILQQFITVRICMDVEDEGELGHSILELLDKAVRSKCNFVLCNKNQSDGEWTAQRADIGLFAGACGEAARTVPLRLRDSSCLCLETSLFTQPEIDISPLLDITPDKKVLDDLNQEQRDVLNVIEQCLK